MRASVAFILFLLAAPAFAGCAALDRTDRWDLTIGLGLITSPRGGSFLEDVQAGAELATRQWRDLGVGVRFTVSNDAAADSTIGAYDRLAARKVAAIIAAVAPDEAGPLAAHAAQKNVPLLLVTPAATPIPAGSMAKALQVAPPLGSEPKALAELVTEEGVGRVVLLHTADGFAAAAADAFTTAFTGNVTDVGTFNRGAQNDVTSGARLVCSSDAEGVVILAPAREAGWVVNGLREGGCLERVRLFASSAARHADLVQESGRIPNGRAYAAGLVGVEPAGSRRGEFGALFVTESGRPPSEFVAEAYDAVSLVTLASFEAHSSTRADPVRATITGAEILAKLVGVAEQPGVKYRDRETATDAAKRGDEIDWVGYAHDFDFTDARAPDAVAYDRWTVTQAGTIDRLA